MNPQTGLRLALLLFCSGLVLSGCSRDADFTLGHGAERIGIVVRTSFAGWYFRDGRPTGLEYDLLKAFAEHADKTLHVRFALTAAQAFVLLERDDTVLASGLLVLPTAYRDRFVASSDYLSLRHDLIHRYTVAAPASVDKLTMGNIETGDNPAHEESLETVRHANNDTTRWLSNVRVAAHQLIHLVDQGVVDYAIADSIEVMRLKSYYPRVKTALTVSDKRPVGWILDKAASDLTAEVNRFFTSIKANGQLSNLIDRHYGHLEVLDYASKLTVIEAFETLSASERIDLFYTTADAFDADWRLLAAISYQESHWDPDAQSPTGVRGMMMITRDIAERFKVGDRRDPQANLRAGTAYLLQLKEQLPETIREPDRTWYALVAYNVGYRHLRRAMRRTSKNNLDASLWVNLRPTLQEMQTMTENRQSLNMPVQYVYNIRAYYDLIRQYSGENLSLLPASEMLSFPLHFMPGVL